MNADPAVMEYFPAPLSRDESAASMARYRAHFAEHGFCFWAVELCADSRFVGAIGLSIPRFVAHFTPCVEIGWRLAREHWGRGYATEGARAALGDGFARLHLKEVVAFTVPPNLRSRRVMEKLGMRTAVEDDFDHPLLAPEHPLRRHLLYRLARTDWERQFPGQLAEMS
jgi:RimJ/RimL family protein N-acetyltransferase